MKIQCENCGTQHELDPPSWVVSSGRAFRFRCSACGHSQSVQPETSAREYHAAPTEVPGTRTTTPTPPAMAPPESKPAPPRIPSMPPPALLDDDPAQPEAVDADDLPEGHDQAVFLKQNGQIYMVRDWETLKRWIVERRVDQNDLVSEGGVRWEPIGSRPDLGPLFGTPAATQAVNPAPTPFPFGGETPFSSGSGHDGWHDDDTEGIPTGLPPLPTEDSAMVEAGEPLPPAMLDDEDDVFVATPIGAEELVGEDPDELEAVAPHVQDEVVPLPSPAPPPVAVPRPSSPRPLDEGTPTAAGGNWDDLLAPDPDNATTELHVPVVTEDDTTRAFLQFDDQWDDVHVQPQGSRQVLYWALAVATLAVGGAVVFVLFVLPMLQAPSSAAVDRTAAIAPDPVPPAPPPPQPPRPEPPRPEPPPPEPVPPEPVADVAPAKPDPVPVVPDPAPPPMAAPASSKQLIAQGWGQVDANPSAAARTFRKVLDQDPDNDEAHYGYGYVLLLSSNPEATPHLCRARDAANSETRREVQSLLTTHRLTCP